MNNTNNNQVELIHKIRRTANWGFYGSIVVIMLVVVFHFSPWHISYQQPNVVMWMLISGTVLAVLAVTMNLLTIRRTPLRLQQLGSLDDKLKGYHSYISNLFTGTLLIVVIECVLIILMSRTTLLMLTMLLVLPLVISHPNMYKMKHDLGLTDEEMTSLFGDAYIAGTTPTEARPDKEDGQDNKPTLNP